MGKNIKGKECGKGIFQRKDGWYIAKFVDKYGKRRESNQGGYAAQGSAKATWPRRYSDNDGSLCSRNKGFIGSGCKAI